MNKTTKPKNNGILTTRDLIILIRQDKSLYGKGLERVGNPALLNVLKNRFKITNFSCDFDAIREELGKVPRKTMTDILLRKALIMLTETHTKVKIAETIGCSVATINKIIKGE